MEKESSIKELINSSLDKVRSIIDADTVVGRQISTPGGTVIIPISKVTMGFASGGLDLPTEGKGVSANFGGGGGTGVTVSPIGFLVVSPDGRVEMLPMVQEKASPIEQLADILDQTPDFINRIKSVITGDATEENTAEVDALELEYERKIRESMNEKASKKKKYKF